MTIAHTPGPWEWDGKFTVAITSADGNSGSFRTQPADARLIAAAPDLLAACKLAEDYATHLVNAPLGTRIQQRRLALSALRAAIAKAEGR